MQFMVRFDVHQPVDMSVKELVNDLERGGEGRARRRRGRRDHRASGRSAASGRSSRWPSSRRTAQLDQALAGLPIIQEMGGSVDTEAIAVYPYSEFAEDLAAAAD